LTLRPISSLGGVSKQSLGSGVDRSDHGAPVNDDNAINGGFDYRAIERVGETSAVSPLQA